MENESMDFFLNKPKIQRFHFCLIAKFLKMFVCSLRSFLASLFVSKTNSIIKNVDSQYLTLPGK